MSRIQKLLVSFTSSKETSLIIPPGEIHSGVLKVVVIFANIKEVIYAY